MLTSSFGCHVLLTLQTGLFVDAFLPISIRPTKLSEQPLDCYTSSSALHVSNEIVGEKLRKMRRIGGNFGQS